MQNDILTAVPIWQEPGGNSDGRELMLWLASWPRSTCHSNVDLTDHCGTDRRVARCLDENRGGINDLTPRANTNKHPKKNNPPKERRDRMGFFSRDIKTMDDLFLHMLRDIYYAEKQIEQALPEMV